MPACQSRARPSLGARVGPGTQASSGRLLFCTAPGDAYLVMLEDGINGRSSPQKRGVMEVTRCERQVEDTPRFPRFDGVVGLRHPVLCRPWWTLPESAVPVRRERMRRNVNKSCTLQQGLARGALSNELVVWRRIQSLQWPSTLNGGFPWFADGSKEE